jgi:hypothetical protein
MFSVGITVPKEVTISEVMDVVDSFGWGTRYDSARTHSVMNADYIELHLKDATPEGLVMNTTLQEGNVTLHGWTFSYTMTLEEWKQMVDAKLKKKIEKMFL